MNLPVGISKWKLGIFLVSVFFVSAYFVYPVFANPPSSTYAPGATLDPDCAPGDSNCTVSPSLPTTLTTSTDITMSNYPLNFDSGTFYIDSENNWVGINTSSPSTALDIVGALRLGANTAMYNILNTSAAAGAPSGDLYWGDKILLNDQGGKFSIDSSGNVSASGTLFTYGNTTVSGTLKIADGTSSAPSLVFANDTNTGIFLNAADQIGWSLGGVQKAKLAGSAFAVATLQTLGTSAPLLIQGLMADGETAVGVNIRAGYALSTAGSKIASFQNATVEKAYINYEGGAFFASSTTVSGTLYVADGLVGTPSMSFTNDTDTGLYMSSAGILDIAIGGVRNGSFASGGISVDRVNNLTSGGSLTLESASTTVAVVVNSASTLSSGKLLSIQNNGTEKAYVDYAGGAYLSSALQQANAWGDKWHMAGSGIKVSMDQSSTSWLTSVSHPAGIDKFRWEMNQPGGIGTLLDLNMDGTAAFYGTVGIGTTTPAYSLDVNGDFRVVNTSTLANTTVSGTLQVADGSASAPSINFNGDPDMGIYRYGSNTLGIATDGNLVSYFDSTALYVNRLRNLTGNLDITGSLNTKIVRIGNLTSLTTGNIVEFYKDSMSTKVAHIDSSGGAYFASSTTVSGTLQVADGTVSAPSLSFTDDTDTGMYSSSDGVLALSINGTQKISFDTTGISSNVFSNLTTGSSTTIHSDVASGGTAIILNSSNSLSSGNIVSFQNAGVEQAYIDNIGRIKGGQGYGNGPTYAFKNDTNTGMYGNGSGDIYWSRDGVDSMKLTASGLQVNQILPNDSNTAMTVRGLMDDGVSAIGVVLNASTLLSTAGAKIVSFQNDEVEKAYINYAGGAYFASSTTVSGVLYVGTPNPTQQIDTSVATMGAFVTQNTTKIAGVQFQNTNAAGSMRFVAAANTGSYIAFDQPGESATGAFFGITKSDGSFLFNYSGGGADTRDLAIGTYSNKDFILGTNNAERVRITNAGYVGIGTSTPGNLLDVFGPVAGIKISDDSVDYVTLQTEADGDFTIRPNSATQGSNYIEYDGDSNLDFLSDERLKKGIVDAEPFLDRVMGLKIRRYNFIKGDPRDYKEIGMIAQEVEPFFPELVGTSNYPDIEGGVVKTLGYTTFGVIAIKAIQEQQDMIDNLNALVLGGTFEGYAQENSENGALVFNNKVEFNAHVAFDGDTVGRTILLAGENEVRIDFEQEYENDPVVTISLTSDVGLDRYFVSEADTTGFVIKISPVLNEDVNFNWHAFAMIDSGDEVVEPITEPASEPVVEPAVEPTAEPVVEPVTEPVTEPSTEPIVEPVTEPTTEPVVEPSTEPIVEPVVEPVTEPVVEPVVEPVDEPATETSTEPAPELVIEPAPEPASEPVAEPIAETTDGEDSGNTVE